MQLAFRTQQIATLQEIILETGQLLDRTLIVFLTLLTVSLDTLAMGQLQEALPNAFLPQLTAIQIISIMEQEDAYQARAIV